VIDEKETFPETKNEGPDVPKPAFELPRMSNDALKQFVLDYIDGKIFIIQQIKQPSVVPMVFLPLAMGALSGVPKEVALEIGTVWEYWDQAGPRGVNGYPMFTSCRFMWKGDWERAAAKIEQLVVKEDVRKKLLEDI
jgi:hypothetical protein